MKAIDSIKRDWENDVNINRARRLGVKGARALPRAALNYALEKVPIVGWLPRYNYRWILNDVIAGLTLGLMLIPQSLAYAKIAKIPVQHGLMSSWLPATLYAFMGTSKDLSTGPTSLIGLLTANVVDDLGKDGYSPAVVASAVAFMMGVYGMALGFLKLGFLLDFISYPTLTGFISAAAIVIGLGQVDNLLGEEGVGDGTAHIIHDVFKNLPTCNVNAAAVGLCGILILEVLRMAGARWGSKYKVVWFLSITRAFLVLVLFTGISYAVNKKYSDPDDYVFEVSEVKANGIETPKMPDSKLISKVVSGSIAAFIASAVEHIAIARAFGARNNYVTDSSQELCYYGLTNFCNSFFHTMGVGGAMSRTAVNSQCNVRSPLSGFVTTGIVLISIYKLTGTLYWIPKATLSAIIITAIWPLIGSPKTYYHFWRTSLADFVAAMITFWVSLFKTTEYGIGIAVAWSIVYCLLRQVFIKPTNIGADSQSELVASLDAARGMPASIPDDTHVFRFNENFFFPNAHRVKTSIFDTIQTYHCAAYSSLNGAEKNRMWSVVGEKRVKALRKRAGVNVDNLPLIRVVVLDFTKVNHCDYTAVASLKDFFNELQKFASKTAEVRFVGVADHVRHRFERAGWTLVDAAEPVSVDATNGPAGTVRLFNNVADAVTAPRMQSDDLVEVIVKGDGDDGTASHHEKM